MILYSSIDGALISPSMATYVPFHSLYKSQKKQFRDNTLLVIHRILFIVMNGIGGCAY